MLEHFFVRPSGIARLRCGPLGTYLDDLATTLHQHRYAPDSIRGYIRTSDQFGRWLSQQGYAIAEMDETLVKCYVGGLQRPLAPASHGSGPMAYTVRALPRAGLRRRL